MFLRLIKGTFSVKPRKLFENSARNIRMGSSVSTASEHPVDSQMEEVTSEILRAVARIVEENKLVCNKFPIQEKVVEFKHPKDLENILPLNIERDGVEDSNLDELCQKIVDLSVKTCHPYFFNQLYHGVDEYGLAATWLSEALNTNNHTFEVSPAFMVIEQALIKYITNLFGWGDQADGIFSPGGSISNMYGMVLARQNKYPDLKTTGLFGQKPLVAFTSEESHYSIKKGASWLGIGMDNVIKVETDQGGNMKPEALEAAILKSKSENKEPFFVNATSGSTVTGAYDDLEKIQKVCTKHQVWLHVDACWGGSVIFSKKRRHLMKGSELVDSIAWNPHKMIGAPLQTSPFITRHKGLLHQANSANATYLFQQDKFYDVSYDTGDKSIQCGRKVDGFKFWFMLKARGEEYIEEMVDNAFNMADYLQTQVQARENFRLVPAFENRKCTNVGFWYIPEKLRGQDETAEWWEEVGKVAPKIKEKMITDGTMMIGYQPLPFKNYKNFFRMVIHAVPRPNTEHMDYVLDQIEDIGNTL
ncbi:cysteine sulfinic acid decarboxylase isoform X1 [Eurytemora carolleeae]|uniref:cysteine sulfinic acid decarboxylase isoform X1 n=1 Tax=Eurytemora carolleeae TaxID=1294199 RepID=UPI000C7700DD|nr:cysteine sulfinic acid decarboxylase isoform X1 [Eurytemora carolleeae]|eukprot:XP_023340138.1 cysteine sulfinic acid decarboxylase-like isoform X1 [Eurytemora affinis]